MGLQLDLLGFVSVVKHKLEVISLLLVSHVCNLKNAGTHKSLAPLLCVRVCSFHSDLDAC